MFNKNNDNLNSFILTQTKIQNKYVVLLGNIISVMAIIMSALKNTEVETLIFQLMIPLQLMAFALLHFNYSGKINKLGSNAPIVNSSIFIIMTFIGVSLCLNIDRGVYSIIMIFSGSIVLYRIRDMILMFIIVYSAFLIGLKNVTSIEIQKYPELFMYFHVLLYITFFFSIGIIYFKKKYFKSLMRTIRLTKDLYKKEISEEKNKQLMSLLNTIGNEFSRSLYIMNQTISDIDKNKINDMDKKIIEIISRSSKKIGKISELFNFLKNKDSLSYFNLKTLIEKEIKIFKEDIFNTKIFIEFKIENKLKENDYFIIKSNEEFISKSIKILIKNSLESIIYSNKEDKKVEIILEKLDNKFILNIKDNGKGISKENSLFIFAPFFTTKKNKKNEIKGINLFLLKGMIESVGGKVFYDENYNDGALFKIELPEEFN